MSEYKATVVVYQVACELRQTSLTCLNTAPGVCGSPPRLLEHPSDVLVARDEPATLRCEAATEPGQPPPTVTWLKDGAEVRTVTIFI